MMLLRTLSICTLLILSGCARNAQPTERSAPGLLNNSPSATTTTTTPSQVGATATGKLSETAKPDGHAKSTAAINSWEIKGLMGVRSPKKSWSAQINWVQNGPGSYHIRLYGPMGGGTVLIDRSNGVVTYQDGNKKVSSKQASTLMQQQTGIALPVESLYYWVRGLPAPGGVGTTQYGAQHQLLMLRQSGYTLTYSDYLSKGGYQLPTKLRLEGHGLLIKLVIKSWIA